MQIQKGLDKLDRGEGIVWDKDIFLEEARVRLEARKTQES